MLVHEVNGKDELSEMFSSHSCMIDPNPPSKDCRKSLRVTDLRGIALKELYRNIALKTLSPRTSQRATRNESHHQYLKLDGGF